MNFLGMALFWVRYKLGLAKEGVDFISMPIPSIEETIRALECTKNENSACKTCRYAVMEEENPDRLDYCDTDQLEMDTATLIRLHMNLERRKKTWRF